MRPIHRLPDPPRAVRNIGDAMRRDQWGELHGQPVLCDYGLVPAIQVKRMAYKQKGKSKGRGKGKGRK